MKNATHVGIEPTTIVSMPSTHQSTNVQHSTRLDDYIIIGLVELIYWLCVHKPSRLTCSLLHCGLELVRRLWVPIQLLPYILLFECLIWEQLMVPWLALSLSYRKKIFIGITCINFAILLMANSLNSTSAYSQESLNDSLPYRNLNYKA